MTLLAATAAYCCALADPQQLAPVRTHPHTLAQGVGAAALVALHAEGCLLRFAEPFDPDGERARV